MFNFGWGEIVLIGIVALIAIGPKELPTVLRTVGQMIGKVRRMANEFQGQFQEALREADIADLKKHAEELTASVKSQVTDFTKLDPLAETRNDIEKAFEEPAGLPTATSTDYAPAAPVTSVETAGALPAPAAPQAEPSSVDLGKIDVPALEPLPPLTSADFAPQADTATAAAEPPPPDKKAGGAA
ncbi:MAG: Sec-independent protein translocase protein TatB [Pseudolabrys sp.]|jgi:sec-independent protein translocase protein TatB